MTKSKKYVRTITCIPDHLWNEIKNILFEKTELSLKNMTTRTIKQPKIQETSSWLLLDCALNLNQNLDQINCSKDFKNE